MYNVEYASLFTYILEIITLVYFGANVLIYKTEDTYARYQLGLLQTPHLLKHIQR